MLSLSSSVSTQHEGKNKLRLKKMAEKKILFMCNERQKIYSHLSIVCGFTHSTNKTDLKRRENLIMLTL